MLALSYQKERVFGVLSSWIFENLHNHSSLPTCWRDKTLLRFILCGGLEWISSCEGEPGSTEQGMGTVRAALKNVSVKLKID